MEQPIRKSSFCRNMIAIVLLGLVLLNSQYCWTMSLNSGPSSSSSSSLSSSSGGQDDYNELDQTNFQPSSSSSVSANYRPSEPNQVLISNLPGFSGGIRGSFRNSIRYVTPYTLQHLLASRFKNSEYPGKRMGSEFLGKKRSSLPAIRLLLNSANDEYQMEKKMGSEFLGR